MTQLFEEYKQERHLHWLSIVYRGLMNLPSYAIFFVIAFMQRNTTDLFYIAIILLFSIFTLPMLILNWYYYTFYFTNKEIVIKHGVFSRQQRNIQLHRIQNIDISQNFLQRILGIARVQAETAGGAESEAVLEYVSRDDAEEIKQRIRKFQFIFEKKKSEEQKAEEEIEREVEKGEIDISEEELQEIEEKIETGEDEEKLIFSMTPVDLAKYGMLRFRPLLLILAVSILSFVQQMYFMIYEQQDFFAFFDTIYVNFANFFEGMNLPFIILYSIGGIILILFVSWLLDILLTTATYFDFKLYHQHDKLYTQYGLFNKRSGTIPIKKLQMMVINTNPLRRYFGYYGLSLETAGFAGAVKGPESAVPLAKRNRVINLSKNIREYELPDYFIPVSKKTIRRMTFRYAIRSAPFFAGAIALVPWTAWFLLLTPLLYFWAYLQWKHRGYFVRDDDIMIKQGVIQQRITILPVEKIQTLNIIETFFQRRLRLATLAIDTAATAMSGDADIIDIDRDEARYIMDMLSEEFLKLRSKRNQQTA